MKFAFALAVCAAGWSAPAFASPLLACPRPDLRSREALQLQPVSPSEQQLVYPAHRPIQFARRRAVQRTFVCGQPGLAVSGALLVEHTRSHRPARWTPRPSADLRPNRRGPPLR